MSMKSFLSAYMKKGFVCISRPETRYNSKTQKKDLSGLLPIFHNTISLDECVDYQKDNDTTALIFTGKRSDLTVIDFDQPKDGEIDGIKIFKEQFSTLNTPISKTGSGGYHVFFKFNGNIAGSTKVIIDGKSCSIDIRNTGQFVIAPPTSYEADTTKRVYTWIKSPLDFPPMVMPDWVTDLLPKKKEFIPLSHFKVEEEHLLKAMEKICELEYTDGEIYEQGENYYKILRNNTGWCNRCKRSHDSEKRTLMLYWNVEGIFYCCLKSRSNSYPLIIFYKRLALPVLMPEPDCIVTSPDDKPEVLPLVEQAETSKSVMKYFNNIFDEGRFLNVVDPKENLIDYIKETAFRIEKGTENFFVTTKKDEFSRPELFNYIIGGRTLFNRKDCYKISCNCISKDGKTSILQLRNILFNDVVSDNINIMKHYSGISFDPTPDQRFICGELNLFNGLSSKAYHLPVEEFEVDVFLYHIRVIFANNNPDYYDYILKWYASILQKRVKNRVGLVLISKKQQTAGKSLFNECFGNYILGFKYTQVLNDVDNLFERFNIHQLTKLFTILDEATFSGDRKIANKMKNKITQPTCYYEIKGKERFENRDFNNFVFLSNNDVPLHIEQTDSRFAVFECSDVKEHDVIYFTILAKAFENTVLCDKFHRYLLDIDLSDFNMKNIPKTEIKKNIIEENQNPLISWLDDKFENDEEVSLYFKKERLIEDLYEEFIEWKMRNSSTLDKYTNSNSLSKYLIKKYGLISIRRYDKLLRKKRTYLTERISPPLGGYLS